MTRPVPSKWLLMRLEEVVEPQGRAIASGPFGSNIGRRFFVDHGVPVIRGNNLTTDMTRFIDDGFVYVTEEKAKELASCEAIPGDLVFTAAGSIGQVGMIPFDARFDSYIISNKQLRARVNSAVIDPLFAFYWFSSPKMVDYIKRMNTGSTIPLINLGVLRQLPILVPPLEEQRAIIRVLGTLDDKIELNRRMSETLDEVARAQFNDAFLGTGSSLSIESQQVPVQSFFEILSGGTPKTSEPENWGGPIPWFSVADTPPGSSTFVLDTAKKITERGLETSPAQVVPAWTTIISARGTIGKLAMAGVPLAFNQSCYGLRATNGPGPSFVYLLANHIVEKLKALSHGSVFSTITRRTFDAVQFPCPPKATLTAFENRVAPLYQRILVATQESATLAELRDALLPKLISGELRVPEAEQLVSEVA